MAPFVEMAHTDKPVRTKMLNASAYKPIECRIPAWPTMKPIRKKTATEHIDKATGQKTPGMVRSERLTVLA
jgi:hypothetical protein